MHFFRQVAALRRRRMKLQERPLGRRRKCLDVSIGGTRCLTLVNIGCSAITSGKAGSGRPVVSNAFIRALEQRITLSEADRASLVSLCSGARKHPGKHDLIREGDPPGPMFVFLKGWGCRYKLLPEGERQILAFMLPGDLGDMHAGLLDEMDHSVATVTPAEVIAIDRARLQEFVNSRPAITRAFRLLQLRKLGTARSWLINAGRRGSKERVAHLMCELFIRAKAADLSTGTTCTMPLSQILLADALGLTPVHVNRVLRAFRNDGVMHLAHGRLVIDDIARLVHMAGFDDNYLQRRLQPRRLALA